LSTIHRFFHLHKEQKTRGLRFPRTPKTLYKILNFTLNQIGFEFFKKYFIYATVSNSATYATTDLNLKTAKETVFFKFTAIKIFKKITAFVHLKFYLIVGLPTAATPHPKPPLLCFGKKNTRLNP
jgi:hypothetical protein